MIICTTIKGILCIVTLSFCPYIITLPVCFALNLVLSSSIFGLIPEEIISHMIVVVFLSSKVLYPSYLAPMHLSKMVFLNGSIVLLWIQLALFSFLDLSRSSFGLRQFSLLFTLLISYPKLFYLEVLLMSIFILSLRHMHTFVSLVALVSFCFIRTIGLSFPRLIVCVFFGCNSEY